MRLQYPCSIAPGADPGRFQFLARFHPSHSLASISMTANVVASQFIGQQARLYVMPAKLISYSKELIGVLRPERFKVYFRRECAPFKILLGFFVIAPITLGALLGTGSSIGAGILISLFWIGWILIAVLMRAAKAKFMRDGEPRSSHTRGAEVIYDLTPSDVGSAPQEISEGGIFSDDLDASPENGGVIAHNHFSHPVIDGLIDFLGGLPPDHEKGARNYICRVDRSFKRLDSAEGGRESAGIAALQDSRRVAEREPRLINKPLDP
jgi:hypothetical protein